MKNIKILISVLSLIFAVSLSVAAQSVTLTSIDGEKVNVQGQNGKVVVLAVGASWLPLSKDQAIITNKLAKKYTGKDVVIYFVATDSNAAKSKNFANDDDIRAFAGKNKLGVKVLRDSDGLLTLKKFGIDQLPSFIIIGKDGKQVGKAFGGIDPDSNISVAISSAIDGLL